MRYPESASELQQWCPWEATAYNKASSKVDDEVTLEVTDISETLVFQLISAFLRGSEHLGDTIMLEFQPYTYRKNLQCSIPNLLSLITTPIIARKNKRHPVECAVVVDVADKPVVWTTGDIVPCQWFLPNKTSYSNIF
jgi:hypothetical protein